VSIDESWNHEDAISLLASFARSRPRGANG